MVSMIGLLMHKASSGVVCCTNGKVEMVGGSTTKVSQEGKFYADHAGLAVGTEHHQRERVYNIADEGVIKRDPSQSCFGQQRKIP